MKHLAGFEGRDTPKEKALWQPSSLGTCDREICKILEVTRTNLEIGFTVPRVVFGSAWRRRR